MESGTLNPPFLLKPAGVQTALASAGLRAWGKNPMVDAAREVILTTVEGVRLLGFMSRQPRPHHKGLAILLHGWEGSSESTYIRTTGRFLFSRGFDVFRLNLRDHGPSHHLNTGIFYAVLLDEVFDAVRQISEAENGNPVFLAGFSLGGNFVLRIARRCATHPIDGLKQVFSISPVLDPDKATDHIDNSRFILKYFLKKWRRSLAIKQRLYPEHYDFSGIMDVDNIREMTERLLARYSTYDNASAYFKGYTLINNDLQGIALPTTILTAADDPIIPVEDFYDLHTSAATRLIVQPHGGHNGFLEGWRLNGWYEKVMEEVFEKNGIGNQGIVD
ncbi:alpha/beta fold hydrolase [uncultured Desulfosarcina sp.]|uniref:YheT family hydrolase n=1 Tax=uncultured Desulfosarcina sp. TaxID=218289 RepID=UPI0029C77E16|nr:alpha/beta fold hydrolase [uncultured Desulfosarcina sp.]